MYNEFKYKTSLEEVLTKFRNTLKSLSFGKMLSILNYKKSTKKFNKKLKIYQTIITKNLVC